MKIEAGKFYKTRNGARRGPMVVSDNPIYPIMCAMTRSTFSISGRYNLMIDEDHRDLIEEWSDLAADESGQSPGFEAHTVNVAQMMSIGADRGNGAGEIYLNLLAVLQEAHDQAASGKGKERHANGKPFTEQPIMAIGRMCGLGFHTGQIQKKVQEATGMAARGETDAAIRELLGAINYAAAAVLLIREQKSAAQ